MFKTCKWNGKDFECCKYFTTLDTELGPCFSINSIQARQVLYSILCYKQKTIIFKIWDVLIKISLQTCCKLIPEVKFEFNFYQAFLKNFRNPKTPKLPLVSNHHVGVGTLYLELYGHSNVSIKANRPIF